MLSRNISFEVRYTSDLKHIVDRFTDVHSEFPSSTKEVVDGKIPHLTAVFNSLKRSKLPLFEEYFSEYLDQGIEYSVKKDFSLEINL